MSSKEVSTRHFYIAFGKATFFEFPSNIKKSERPYGPSDFLVRVFL